MSSSPWDHTLPSSPLGVFSDLSETTAKVEARKGEDAVDEAAIESKIRSLGMVGKRKERWLRGEGHGGKKGERKRERARGGVVGLVDGTGTNAS